MGAKILAADPPGSDHQGGSGQHAHGDFPPRNRRLLFRNGNTEQRRGRHLRRVLKRRIQRPQENPDGGRIPGDPFDRVHDLVSPFIGPNAAAGNAGTEILAPGQPGGGGENGDTNGFHHFGGRRRLENHDRPRSQESADLRRGEFHGIQVDRTIRHRRHHDDEDTTGLQIGRVLRKKDARLSESRVGYRLKDVHAQPEVS